jgi:hypothetical protein
VQTSTALNSVSTQEERLLQPVKLLAQREDYRTCHIQIPGEAGRLPAIALDGKFYSFFRSLQDPAKALTVLLKLSALGNQAVLTPTHRGYAIWVNEPAAVPSTPTGQPNSRYLSPTYGPADCWIIGDHQPGYRTCSLKVPDLPDIVPGLANGQKLFSLYRLEPSPDSALQLGARLSQRGDELVILHGAEGYAICIYEPGATVAS